MSDNALFDTPGLAEIYDAASTHRDDFAYCAGLAEGANSVLDLGCGTGEFLVSLDCDATGVDPAAAMLAIAAARPGGAGKTWVEADGSSVRLGRKFDLIVLTGHAFQVFLSDAGQQAVLETIAAHLTPKGRFVFDTRNPDFPARKSRKLEEGSRRFQHPELGEVEAWNMSEFDQKTGILSYSNNYRIVATGERRGAAAQIRYTPKSELETRIKAAGLRVDRWLGDWHGAPYEPDSKEIIPVGRLA